MTLENRLRAWAAARGYGLGITGTAVIDTVRDKLEKRRASGLIEADFFRENLEWFSYLDGVAIPAPRSVVMVAVPSPIGTLPVTVGGRTIDALIPPTYIRYKATFEDVLADMKANAFGGAVQAEILKVPLKSTAAHMGLVVYGRNNITYSPGLGSGFQLCGYLVGTGKRLGERRVGAEGRETPLERCARCKACVKACPTGAIREDRFLISAERCFTLHSESRRPMPAWARLPRSMCLIGCMDCQLVCPENKGRLKTVPSGIEFSAAETEAVIEAGRGLATSRPGAGESAAEKNPAFASARTKFGRLGMTEDIDVMGRNLEFLLARK